MCSPIFIKDLRIVEKCQQRKILYFLRQYKKDICHIYFVLTDFIHSAELNNWKV